MRIKASGGANRNGDEPYSLADVGSGNPGLNKEPKAKLVAFDNSGAGVGGVGAAAAPGDPGGIEGVEHVLELGDVNVAAELVDQLGQVIDEAVAGEVGAVDAGRGRGRDEFGEIA
jgi:hypothetical protein